MVSSLLHKLLRGKLNPSCCRLLEFAASYYDLANFPDGEAKRALQRAVKNPGKVNGGNQKDDHKSR
jgi:hypothetical protein